ncbi:MAG TPA: hypothetical protein VFT70_09255 [Nocardioides sp.]|nr:hypothetical protein [Nocardioides sp.]
MDDAAWAALTLGLTVLGGIWTWMSFRRRGAASGLRALGFTLLPLAAYLTKTLQMFTRIADAITSWAAHLVFSPVVWFGVLLGGVGIVLIVVAGTMRSRQLGKAPTKGSPPPVDSPKGRPAIEGDPEMAEIEAILRKRGIS